MNIQKYEWSEWGCLESYNYYFSILTTDSIIQTLKINKHMTKKQISKEMYFWMNGD